MNKKDDNNLSNSGNDSQTSIKESSWNNFCYEIAEMYMNGGCLFLALEVFVTIIGLILLMAFSWVLEFFN